MKTAPHNIIISKVAKQAFKPHGITRKGQSRLFFDDQKWFATLIEFQPSRRGGGTYLNIGVHFHWPLKDYFSYNFAYGDSGRYPFVEFEDETQFTTEMEKRCALAIEKNS